MKRLLLLAVLLLTGSLFVFAQEGKAEEVKPEGEGKKTEEVAEVWKWANFAILAVALGYIVAKTIPPAFKQRGADIQKGIAEARKIKEDADKRAAEVEAKIKSLAADIEKLRVESKAEMQAEGDRIRKVSSDGIITTVTTVAGIGFYRPSDILSGIAVDCRGVAPGSPTQSPRLGRRLPWPFRR